MKTKIITLESHDDLISVRDQLSWAKTARILLVWPKYEKVSLRVLDLKVLQRHADSLGAQLGLVTRRMNVRRDAESLGIPVFKTTTAAQKGTWTESPPRTRRTLKLPRRDLRAMRDGVYGKEAEWRTSLPGRVAAFAVGVLAVLVLAGLFVPRAVVTLNPEAQTTVVVIPVNASLTTTSVSLNGAIPARSISMTVSHEQTVPVTSRISIPNARAVGIVQFTNMGPDEITIPAGTVVATNTLVRFATLNTTRLPAGRDGMVEVKIEALEAGRGGNVDRGAIRVIEGTLGLSARVSNPEPTTGGGNANVTGATEEDRADLRERVLEELGRIAKEQIHVNIGENDLLIADTLKVGEIQREDYSPPIGEAGADLTLSMQAEFMAGYLLAEDLKLLAASSVTASIPQGFSPVGTLTFSPIETPITDDTGITRFPLQASQSIRRNLDMMQAFNLIRGRDAQTAAAALKSVLLLQSDPQITITPSWWKWLPLMPFNISMEIK